ncbi:hypothetical protein [Ideonella sp. YS5]|uniref:hypothetical protein n=1 Tax=Ideonella sp. YS5 TaxID=3453714 RepID=UPI003EEDB4A9
MHPNFAQVHPLTNSTESADAIDIGLHLWEDAVRILLVAHRCATHEGRRDAEAHLVRMARTADLAVEAVTLLSHLPPHVTTHLDDESSRRRINLLRRAQEASRRSESEPARVANSVDQPSTSTPRHGMLAQRFGQRLELQICYCAAGFYLGTYSADGPFTRESREYWRTREQAQRALETGHWTQRENV